MPTRAQSTSPLALAALRSAVQSRHLPAGCIFHTDRGSQYASKIYHRALADAGLQGSMISVGDPFHNAQAESFMKTLKVEEVYIGGYETFQDVAERGQASATTLAHWGDWLVLAAELTWLRSRLMLASPADASSARDEAGALRRQLIGRAEMAAARSWLDSRLQLGIEVFERGAPESPRSAGRGRSGDITALLRACLVVLAVPEDVAKAFRVVVPFWSVADAVGRMRRKLDEMGEMEVGLEAFFPVIPPELQDRDRRCRAAMASEFLGWLELAREGVVILKQGDGRVVFSSSMATSMSDNTSSNS